MDTKKIYWFKSILNGLWAWLLGMAIYMIPALVVGFKMGFELGPQLKDNAAVSAEISQTIATMYRDSLYLHIFFFVIMLGLIVWRSYKVVRLPQSHALLNAVIVAAVPSLITVLSSAKHFDLFALLGVVAFFAASIAVGLWKK